MHIEEDAKLGIEKVLSSCFLDQGTEFKFGSN